MPLIDQKQEGILRELFPPLPAGLLPQRSPAFRRKLIGSPLTLVQDLHKAFPHCLLRALFEIDHFPDRTGKDALYSQLQG